MRLVPCPAIEPGSCGLQNLLVLDANSPIAQRLNYPYIAIVFLGSPLSFWPTTTMAYQLFHWIVFTFKIFSIVHTFKVPIPHKL
jgi:hypothetical protein